ncbi:endothelin-converting enzyme 1 [Rhipicephalus microplus]|uniref:endothelin-converting enzyme 1 n=1 Tax=Rhipicephalus microplus TaxID=6941 RepID=UPI003F6DA262
MQDNFDSAAKGKIKPAAVTQPSSGPVDVQPLQDTSLVYRREKKAHCSIPALEAAAPLVATWTRRRTWILKVAAILTFLTFVVGGTLILAYWLGGGSRDEDLFCESYDCRHHEALIGVRLNRSIDPCVDFSAFVCSAWTASSVYQDGSLSTQQDVVETWSMRFDSLLKGGQGFAEARKKALNMLETCQNRPNETFTVQVLRKFMDERNLSWPAQCKPNVHPMRVLLELDLQWGTSLWFHVRLLPKLHNGRRAMVISPAASIVKQSKHHRKLVYSGAFFDYWRKYYELFAPPGIVPATETESKKEEKVHTFVLHELLEACLVLSIRQMMLKNIEKNITKISSKEWIDLLNKNLQAHPAITGEDHVIVTHDMLLYAIDKITRTQENCELVQNIAWLFLQVVGPVADFDLLELSEESLPNGPWERTAVSAARAAFCLSEVEWTYRFLIISLHTLANFPSDEREKLDARLRVLREAALDKVANATRIDRLSKRRAQEKLNATLTVLWPPEKLIDESSISLMYTDFPQTDTTFAPLWLRLRQSFHNMSKNKMYDEALYMPHNLALPLLDYDYILNTVHISQQALSAPVFYAQGTLAMFYGGLGFLYASQLVRALDKHGLRINGSGHITGLWLSSAWRHAVNDVDNCLGGYVSHFPEIPALEVSYSALERELSQSSDSHQRLHDGFTERQLFFVTLCFLMCSRPGVESTGDCNKAVMNFPPFARTFACPITTRMRPAKPCAFFDYRV